jgi:hypothetical protein
MKMSNDRTPTKTHAPTKSAGLAWAAVGGVVVLGIILTNLVDRSPPAVPRAESTSPDTNSPVASAGSSLAEFQKLAGRWVRPDGGYVLEIQGVDAQGKASAGYFNPQPIHVARAEFTRAGGATKLFVELRDVNYPGSTYTLVYLPDRELLAGEYFQALQQQTYEVYFERMK